MSLTCSWAAKHPPAEPKMVLLVVNILQTAVQVAVVQLVHQFSSSNIIKGASEHASRA